MTDPRGSVSHWLDGLRDGDSRAAQELWDRYFARLVAVAKSRLLGLARDVAGEDVALSALKSVMLGVREDRFPQLTDSSGLWPLLVTITARKSISERRRQLALRRTPARECRIQELQDYIGVEPSPSFALEVVDELERLMKSLDDPTLGTIVERKLGGFTNDDIAAELGITSRTVMRKLKRIRQEWRSDNNVEESSPQDLP
jgi:DNA-directed RNA polymerase specialized sigma24 family protein